MRELVALVHVEATQSAELGRVLHGLREDCTTRIDRKIPATLYSI